MKKGKKFITTTYEIVSDKLKHGSFTAAMVSDLHNVQFGSKNQKLLDRIAEEKPDMILIAGDLVLGKKGASLKEPLEFLKGAVKIAPVFYATGNHEQRMKLFPEVYGREYLVYEKKAKNLGVKFLENRTEAYFIGGEEILLSGLALPYHYYEKAKKKQLESKEISKLVGKPSKEKFQILLAHTPRYAKTYLDWGADLTFSGHYHGGMVRLPFLGGVISPDWRLFPSYCRGMFRKENHHLIVGAGLGEHTMPLRIFNPRELVIVRCRPAQTARVDF